jgi:hypothetical protein
VRDVVDGAVGSNGINLGCQQRCNGSCCQECDRGVWRATGALRRKSRDMGQATNCDSAGVRTWKHPTAWAL